MSTATLQRQCCIFRGHVQGVGFRYTVHNLAIRHDVVGYVRNMDDGGVELVVEGPCCEIKAFLEDIQSKMCDCISEMDIQASDPSGKFDRFCIKH